MSENTQHPEELSKSEDSAPTADGTVVTTVADEAAGQPAPVEPAVSVEPSSSNDQAADTPVVAEATAQTSGDEASAAPAGSEPVAAEGSAEEGTPAESAPEAPKQPEYDVEALYAELAEAKTKNETVEVEGIRRVRGGILAEYKHMPLFLPTSHLSLKANPSENDLLSLIHKSFPVHVHELSKDDKSRVIITRRKLLRKELMADFHVGQEVEGRVSSITDFGAFVDIGGVDGMVHVSRISRRRITHPSDILKKGDTIKAIVKEINMDNERISLSMKELEEDVWASVAEEFPAGTRHKGLVRGLTDFGAYVQLKPGVEGLVHISEMSWARRLKHPSELLEAGQEIEVEVLDVAQDKKKISLGYKQSQPNPWTTMVERFAIGAELSATVKEVLPRGVVVTLADDVDAFLPKGKMHPSLRGQKAPFNVGDNVQVLVMDVVPENHSLIVGMEGFDQKSEQGERGGERGGNRGERGGNRGERGGNRGERGGNRGGNRNDNRERGSNPTQALGTSSQNVTLLELLSDDEKRKLFGDAVVDKLEAEEKVEKVESKVSQPQAEQPAAAANEAPVVSETPAAPAAEQSAAEGESNDTQEEVVSQENESSDK